MWWLLVLLIPFVCGFILCYNWSRGVSPPDEILTFNDRNMELRWKKT